MNGFVLIILVVFLFGGCYPGLDKPEPKKPDKKPVTREVIEGFTGKTAVDNLKRARPKIDTANETGKQKREDVDELTKP